MNQPNYDRRLHVRHPANKMLVRVTCIPNRAKHEGETGSIVNLSVGGCAIRFNKPLALRPKQRMHLAIVVLVDGVAKVHHRVGTVAHVTNGIVGFATEVWSAQAERDIDVWLKK